MRQVDSIPSWRTFVFYTASFLIFSFISTFLHIDVFTVHFEDFVELAVPRQLSLAGIMTQPQEINYLNAKNYFISFLRHSHLSTSQYFFLQLGLLITLYSCCVVFLARHTKDGMAVLIFTLLLLTGERFLYSSHLLGSLIPYSILLITANIAILDPNLRYLKEKIKSIYLFVAGILLGMLFFLHSNSIFVVLLCLVFAHRKGLVFNKLSYIPTISLCLPILVLLFLRVYCEEGPIHSAFFSSLFDPGFYKHIAFNSKLSIHFIFLTPYIHLINEGVHHSHFIIVIFIWLSFYFIKEMIRHPKENTFIHSKLDAAYFFGTLIVILYFEFYFKGKYFVNGLFPFFLLFIVLSFNFYDRDTTLLKQIKFFSLSCLIVIFLIGIATFNLKMRKWENGVNARDLIKWNKVLKRHLDNEGLICDPNYLFRNLPFKNVCEGGVSLSQNRMEIVNPKNLMEAFGKKLDIKLVVLDERIKNLMESDKKGPFQFIVFLNSNFEVFSDKNLYFYSTKKNRELLSKMRSR